MYILYWISIKGDSLWIVSSMNQKEIKEKYPNAIEIIPMSWGEMDIIEKSPYFFPDIQILGS